MKNKILVEWSKEIGKRNRVNVKRIVEETDSITAKGIIVVKFNLNHRSNSIKANAVSLQRRKDRGSALKKALETFIPSSQK